MTAALEVIPDDEWAEHVAARLAALIAPGRSLCLATGSTPVPVYREMAGRAGLDGVEIFLLDEFGGLPPGDPGRCLSMLVRDLLGPAGGGHTAHAPDVDADDPEEAAARYGDLISQRGIDLAVVGLGANGHVGMNEPGTTLDRGTRVVELDPATSEHALAYGASIRPTWGITVGISELMSAAEVWVLVTGGHKTDILNRALHGEVGPEVPATFLTEHPNCVFLVDESAATLN